MQDGDDFYHVALALEFSSPLCQLLGDCCVAHVSPAPHGLIVLLMVMSGFQLAKRDVQCLQAKQSRAMLAGLPLCIPDNRSLHRLEVLIMHCQSL